MFFSLEGKVAVVTGAASGIGKATAERYLKAGAKVVSADLRWGDAVAQSESNLLMEVDVTKEEQVKNLMETAVKTFGHLDIVVNNAGIGEGADFIDTTEEMFDKHMAVNAKGVLFGIKHGAANMTDGGSIIITSSGAGFIGIPSYGAYAASKAAAIMMTKTAALELGPRGIRVNTICPGTINTPMQHSEAGQAELAISKLLCPMERIGEPEEVAAVYHFLGSDDSAFISGNVIPVDGGISAGLGLGIFGTLLESVGA